MDAADRAEPPRIRRLHVVAIVLLGLAIAAGGMTGLAFVATGWPDTPGERALAPIGSSSEGYAVWERNDDGRPVRWDACSPIEIVFAPRSAPAGARADLETAVATLREETGLDLVVTDTTNERPAGDRSPFQPERYGQRWAPVLLAWASPGENGLPLRDTDRGVAIPIAVGPLGERTYVSGQVVLNADRHDLRPGTADRVDSWGATILHELVHVLGLDHVDDPNELMSVYPGEGPVEFGDGDRAGLRAVGAGTGCLEVPPPREVDVTREVEAPEPADG